MTGADGNIQSLVNQNIKKTIFTLSVPGMISSVLQTLYQLIDAYWVGQLGAESLAAIGACSFILWAVYSLTALSVNGITTLVAQNIGAGKSEAGRFAAGQGLMLNTINSLVLIAVIYLFQGYLYQVMGLNEQVTAQAYQYMNFYLPGLLFSFWFTGFEAVFRGLGDTKTPMIILALALTVNAVLDPVFIFGWFGLPAMHIAGASFATVIAHVLAALICFILLKRKTYVPTLVRNRRRSFDGSIARRILSIGTPIALSGFFFSLIYVFLTNIISRFGTAAVAAVGVCHRIEGIAWFACVGFSVAASTLVGQFVGANKIGLAGKSGWLVSAYGVGTLLMVSVIFYLFPEWLMGIFTDSADVRKIGVEYLRIIAIFEIFLALEVIIEGAFSGAGYTLPVMLVAVPVTAARIPLAWYLAISLEMGTNGIWWAIALTTFIKGALNTILFAMGMWKKRIHLAPGY